MSQTPSNQIPFVPENTLDPAAGLNLSLVSIDALLQLTVLGRDNTPPLEPVNGDRWIVGDAPVGSWAGASNKLARYVAEGEFWQFYDAWWALNRANETLLTFNGTQWSEMDVSGGDVSTFIEQTDTPAAYVGQAGKGVAVNATEDGLEFTDPPVTSNDGSITSMVSLTQAEYDALATPSPTTFYVIVEDVA